MRTTQENEKKPTGKPKSQQIPHHQLQFAKKVSRRQNYSNRLNLKQQKSVPQLSVLATIQPR
jgi:hypothetical protein